ncbi:MAG: aminodeoxychorismate/anthranilate synthase component II [Candidatus Eisenbacteria bacterium]|uniref:Aminodeoxychorismate/anthranilate synthase component II n=1 Tax=Eiseniibacteriota bacterium TaxID=2212470 RepID=A0A7Y2H121_UNCEI|nr:aminodeoxychorismate/anthranilate synthase component II [Candidatus Eisenbacteria bacterium]
MNSGDSPRIFMLDNYDSFTYNLVQYLLELGAQVEVERNDKLTAEDVIEGDFDGVVISPGPGIPSEAGISKDLVRATAEADVPTLGVCLGHQAMGEVYGAAVVRADRLMHGKTSLMHHDGSPLYEGLENPFQATRYHSLLLQKDTVRSPLTVTSWTEEGEIMGLKHQEYRQWGVQFHPESILTPQGKELLSNFLRLCAKTQETAP